MRHDLHIFPSPASGRATRNLLTLPVLCAAVLIAQLDTSVANLALRAIGYNSLSATANRPAQNPGRACRWRLRRAPENGLGDDAADTCVFNEV